MAISCFCPCFQCTCLAGVIFPLDIPELIPEDLEEQANEVVKTIIKSLRLRPADFQIEAKREGDTYTIEVLQDAILEGGRMGRKRENIAATEKIVQMVNAFFNLSPRNTCLIFHFEKRRVDYVIERRDWVKKYCTIS